MGSLIVSLCSIFEAFRFVDCGQKYFASDFYYAKSQISQIISLFSKSHWSMTAKLNSLTFRAAIVEISNGFRTDLCYCQCFCWPFPTELWLFQGSDENDHICKEINLSLQFIRVIKVVTRDWKCQPTMFLFTDQGTYGMLCLNLHLPVEE